MESARSWASLEEFLGRLAAIMVKIILTELICCPQGYRHGT